MDRFVRIALVSLFVMAGLAPASPASAGGGCHGMSLSDEVTNEVKAINACFTPTVARVDTGDTVTFVGEDFEHNVTGVPTAFNALQNEQILLSGTDLAFRFDDPGTYPYVCTIHPSMAGVIVVGNGVPKGGKGAAALPQGGGGDTAAGDTAADEPAANPVPATDPASTRSGWVIGGALAAALALAGLIALMLQRAAARQRGATGMPLG
jgi:plastocyanin